RGLISEQPNEGLFFLDTGNAPKGRRLRRTPEKPLHVDLVLQPLSKVPPPKNISAHQTPNGRKEKKRREFWEKKAEKGIFPRGERRLRRRLSRGGAPKPQKPPELGRSDPQRGFYDIWGEHNPLEEPLAGQDLWYLQQTKKLPVQVRFGGHHPDPDEAVAHSTRSEVIGAGGAYNPPFQAHQDLLLRALEVETRRKREEEKVERRLKVHEEPPTEESKLREQLEGLLEEEEEEEQEQEGEGKEEPPKKREQPGKKTEKQRRKEKEEKEKRQLRVGSRAAALRLQGLFRLRRQLRLGSRVAALRLQGLFRLRRQLRVGSRLAALRLQGLFRLRRQLRLGSRLAALRLQGLFRLRSLRRALRERQERERERRRLRELTRSRKEREPRRLGRKRYEDAGPEVQLSEEIPENLRSLRPEGHLLRDRFKSLQRRNLIEPRERAKFKRRYRVKYVEKRAFRAVT
ncbi:ribosome biogenesis protein NOP53, partial [Pipra filicauda]|uniref:Ribosome biogenesis protein NOP53 n=1 Tax=Pipra filicauda TaxID=649802 RepID=A0A7R5K5S7_9PASS